MKYIRRRWPAALSILLIVLLVLFGNGRRRRRWDHMEASRLVFSEGLERTGEAYGVMNEGPALTLPAGAYTLSWDIETDGQSTILITTSNDAAISPSQAEISAQNSTGTVSFEAIDQIYNLQILVSYESGSYLRVNRMDLVGNAQTDWVFTCIFVLAAAALLNILHVRGWLTPRRRGELGEVISGTVVGRESDDEMTYFKTTGSAVMDIVTAQRIYERALEKGIEQIIEF